MIQDSEEIREEEDTGEAKEPLEPGAEISEVHAPSPPLAVEIPEKGAELKPTASADENGLNYSPESEPAAPKPAFLPVSVPEINQTTQQTSTEPIDITDQQIDDVIAEYSKRKRDLEIFVNTVFSSLTDHPDLYRDGKCIVHSAKFRLKDPNHLREKIRRKAQKGKSVSSENLFTTITDLGGVRILHLFQDDFRYIDALIRKKVNEKDWYLFERPVANTWDPEAKVFFEKFDLTVRQTETLYTSVHYVVKPRPDSPLCCEVQVRTLFEEIWGEVDHQINYPQATENISLHEQLLVLSKIAGAGSRLLDSIRRVHDAERQY